MNDQNPTTSIRFDNSYALLPEAFFARLAPTPVAGPRLVRLNHALAEQLRLDADWLASPAGIAMLSGSEMPPGAEPIACAYGGHQFGNFVPQLGDGRALLLGEIVDGNGRRLDIQLKGSGRTPFSRGGDGRAALGPVLREYIVSEAFAALGIPTTRALAAVTTGEPVFRETAVPGAIFTRVAASHVRVGTFQYFAARGDVAAIRRLADYVIDRHYPSAKAADNPYLALLAEVIGRQATLVARWMHVGFIHGVMNTDNMAISGETIDFGPCAFLDAYDPAKVFSSIDRNGRYAYQNQPRIAQWNLARLAETLLPVIDVDEAAALAKAQAAIEAFRPAYDRAFADGARAKLGLRSEQPTDGALHADLLDMMAIARADYTTTFRALIGAVGNTDAIVETGRRFANQLDWASWADRWQARLAAEPGTAREHKAVMSQSNPAIIPRNHRIENAITAATIDGDFSFFHRLVEALADPYSEVAQSSEYSAPPAIGEEVRQTFCGT